MSIEFVTGPEAMEWVWQRIAEPGNEARWVHDAICCRKGGRIICGALYEEFDGTNLEVHLAVESGESMPRQFVAAGFHYPFCVIGARRITGRVAASNTRAIRLNLHLGYVIEGTLRQCAADGEDIIIFGMLASECRWLKQGVLYHGQESQKISQSEVEYKPNQIGQSPAPAWAYDS